MYIISDLVTMEKRVWIPMWAILVLGFLIQVVSSCEMKTAINALEKCRKEREDLNDAATTVDSHHSHICTVFEAYARCMDPEVGDCEGVSTEAYRLQKQIYTGFNYNCTVSSMMAPQVHLSGIAISMTLLTAAMYL